MRWRDGIVEVGRRGTEMKAGRWAKAESGHVRRILKWIFYETICSHNFQIMNRDTISGQIQWLCVLFWVNMNRLSLTLLYLFRFAAERILPSYSSVSLCVFVYLSQRNSKHETMTRVFRALMRLPSVIRWANIFRVGFISHHWKVSFLIFFNKDFLVAVATREKFVIHTENMRNDFSIEFLCECVLWIESSMQHRKGKKSPVKISYYLHGNIFQLFFCQVSVCSIDWPHSVNHTHKFAHILCSLILPATGIRFQIQYLFYIHEIKPIIRIYIENTWILWLSLPLSENETESEENSTTLFLLLFYLHEQNWMCNTLLWSITNITFAASMMS